MPLTRPHSTIKRDPASGRGGSQTAPTDLSEGHDVAGGPNCGPKSDTQSEPRTWAEAIDRAGLAAPATLALDIARPLGWIGGQMLWVLQPLLEGLGITPRRDRSTIYGIARFLERDGSIDELIEQIKQAGQGPRSRQQRGSR